VSAFAGGRRFLTGGVLFAVLLAADQVTKYFIIHRLWPGQLRAVIPGYLNFVRSHNTGGVFSLLAGKPLFFTILSLAAIALLIYLYVKLDRKPAATLATATVLAGAFGNLIDRIRFGFVIDFIDLHVQGWHWYIFNVADAAISLGAIALVIATFRDERRKAPPAENPAAAAGPAETAAHTAEVEKSKNNY
jgi:signal peptidase II